MSFIDDVSNVGGASGTTQTGSFLDSTFLDGFMGRFNARVNGGQDWPPYWAKEHWESVELYRWRALNNRARLVQSNTRWHGAAESIYVPVPLAREMARLSAALLFSEPAKITHAQYETELTEVLDTRGVHPFLQSSAEFVAAEGRGGIKVFFDEQISESVPLMDFIHEDRILWNMRHGYVIGAIVIYPREDYEREGVLYRLLEEHGKGYIKRKLFEGTGTRLGKEVDLARWGDDALEEEVETGLDSPTLIRWDNVPGGQSDYAGLESLFDVLDEAESLMLEKARLSRPWIFGSRKLADENGRVEIGNLVFLEESDAARYLDEGTSGRMVEHVQPDMQTSAHVEWIDHVREYILQNAGYSLASWGLDKGGSADSGKALKLRQSRTLLTRAGKDHMATEAIAQALGVALAWADSATEVKPYRPVVELSDGLPVDNLELAQEIKTLSDADALSTEEKVRRQHPDWADDRIQTEIAAIKSGASPSPLDALLNGNGFGTSTPLPGE